MAWKRIVEWTKPNDSVDFEFLSLTVVQHISENYELLDKSKSFVVSFSDDGLIRYHTRIFKDEDSRNEFVSDLIILDGANERDVVNTSRGISKSVSFDAEYIE
jgi:hypothetical protein